MSNFLSKMPNIAIPRTRFKQEFNHSTSFKHGKLIPIDCFEVLPGDNISCTISSLIRMATPIAPIFGNITAYLHAFFVPMRLIWDDAEKFYGDPSNHDKISSITPVDPATVSIPSWTQNSNPFAANTFFESVACYLGKPYNSSGTDNFAAQSIQCSNLKERGYYTIWNEYFRPSNLILPCLINKGSSSPASNIGTDYNGQNLTYYHPVLPVCKKYDYFTACTLSPQFGGSVALPLGTSAPVYLKNIDTSTILGGSDIGIDQALNAGATVDVFKAPAAGQTEVKLFTDLSTATAATINNIRYAFQVQKYLERSNYGSKFFEILNAHYGVTSPDGRLQRPDRLGYHHFYINVSQVLSTANSGASGSSEVGQTGAVSVTGDKVHLFSGAFTEPGYLYVMLDTKYDRSYSGGLLREDKRKSRFEFYSPEFANLGDQAIYKNELAMYTNFSSHSMYGDGAVFGYQEHWAEYRYRKDRVSGLLNPTVTVQSGVAGLTFWNLSDVFDSVDSTSKLVSLNNDFLFEDRDSLARCLTTGISSNYDYLADFHFEYIVTRELPLYSIPGLIDHFGAL